MKSVQVFEGDGVAEHHPPPAVTSCHHLKFVDTASPTAGWIWLTGWIGKEPEFSHDPADAIPIPIEWSDSIGIHTAIGLGKEWKYRPIDAICWKVDIEKWPTKNQKKTWLMPAVPDRRANLYMAWFGFAITIAAMVGWILNGLDVLTDFQRIPITITLGVILLWCGRGVVQEMRR